MPKMPKMPKMPILPKIKIPSNPLKSRLFTVSAALHKKIFEKIKKMLDV